MTIIKNVLDASSKTMGISVAIVPRLTNNTEVISKAAYGFFIQALFTEIGKDMHPSLGYAGAFIGGAIEGYITSDAASDSLNGTALNVDVSRNGLKQSIYCSLGLLPLPISIAAVVIPEVTTTFIRGAFVDQFKKGEDYSLSEGCKKVATVGIMGGIDGVMVVGGFVGGSLLGPVLLAAMTGSGAGAFIGSIVGGYLFGMPIPYFNEWYQEHVATKLASFCPDSHADKQLVEHYPDFSHIPNQEVVQVEAQHNADEL
jgi:hypothetical protein